VEYRAFPAAPSFAAVRLTAEDSVIGPSTGTVHRSEFVVSASFPLRFDAKHSSRPSGEKESPRPPPSWKTGLSTLPGVMSLTTAPESASTSRTCARLPSRQLVQWR